MHNASQAHHSCVDQQQQQQQQYAAWSPFGATCFQQPGTGRPLSRCSCPGDLGQQPKLQQDPEHSVTQLSQTVSSSWCSSSLCISRQSGSTSSVRSQTSSPLQQHWQQLLSSSLQTLHFQQQLTAQQPAQYHSQHQQLMHQRLPCSQAAPPPRASTFGPYSPCCSASSDFGELCCCNIVHCSRSLSPAAMHLGLAPACKCKARPGSTSSTHSSSHTHLSNHSHGSVGSDRHAPAAIAAAVDDGSDDDHEFDATLDTAGCVGLCRVASAASSTWSSTSHHVASRPAPGGPLGIGISWVMPQFGGREVLADYEFGRILGRGTFGVTRLVTHRKTASLWACKTICKASIAASPAAQSDVRHEVAILQHLKGHNGIVQLKGVYEDERNIHFVMELCTGGDLLDYISRFGRLQEQEAADVASVILSTLAHCHRLGVVHRDIKPENFLLGSPTLLSAPAGSAASVLKISDFGVSAFYTPRERFTEIVGTPFYMAPEVLERCYGPEADVWSAGVVVFLMLAGRLPFDGATDRQIIKAVLDSEPDFDHPAWFGISSAAKDCVAHMLVKDPQQRCTVQQLLAHPWLAGRVRSSCCSNPGEPDASTSVQPHGSAGGCCQPGSSSSGASSTLQPVCCELSAGQHHVQHLQQLNGSSVKGHCVNWATPCAAHLGSPSSPEAQHPGGQASSQSAAPPPALSPLKHVRSRLGDWEGH